MRAPQPRVVKRQVDRFHAEPSSMRNAAVVIITVTIGAVLIGSLVMWVFDPRDFPDFGTALWFTLQTITTVGYGDVTPTGPIGKVVAGVVMLVAIAFLTVVTALITSTFIDAAQRERRARENATQRDEMDRVEAGLEEVVGRLTAIEGALARIEQGAAVDANPATDRSTVDGSTGNEPPT
jgi:voltage-gated potassium channel